MKKQFEGMDARAQFGRSGHGDADSRIFSLAAGQNFADDRGNFTFAVEYAAENRLPGTRRSYGYSPAAASFMENPHDRGDDPNIPDHVPFTDVRFYDSSPDGAVDVDGDFFQDFNGDDTPFDFGSIPQPSFYGAPIDPFYQAHERNRPRERRGERADLRGLTDTRQRFLRADHA